MRQKVGSLLPPPYSFNGVNSAVSPLGVPPAWHFIISQQSTERDCATTYLCRKGRSDDGGGGGAGW